jgi:hypothetical protein
MKGIDYAGRAMFLKALEAIKWKGDRLSPRAALRVAVLPAYETLFRCLLDERRKDRTVIAQEWFVNLASLRSGTRSEAVMAAAAVDEWAEMFGFTENDWLLEAAHETARACVSGRSDCSEWCFPAPPFVQPPQPIFRAWAYPVESWASYRREMDAQHDYLLRIYKAEVEKQQRARPADAIPKKHARWTALRAAGHTYGEIQIAERRRHTSAAPQTLQREARKFAREIGLVHNSIT